MTPKLNKSVLATAIAAAAFIAGSASAANLSYNWPTQITYAKDLFATDSRTIDLPPAFTVRATNAAELAAVGAVAANDEIEIVVSLGQGNLSPRFQSSATTMQPAELIKNTIYIGRQLNGAGGFSEALDGLDPNATVTFSSGEREMRIRFKAASAGDGSALTPPLSNANFSVGFGSGLRLYDLQGALLENSVINAGISITNITRKQQILAGNAVLARSAWGENVGTTLPVSNKWIDAQRCSDKAASRVWFTPPSPTAPPSVGQSCAYVPGREWFNAGSVDVSIAQARHAGLGATPADISRVNDFDGGTPTPWGLSSTIITYKVLGEDLAGFNGQGGNNHMWLDTSAACARAKDSFLDLTVNNAGTEATASHSMGNPATAALSTHFLPLTNSANTVSMHVCFSANGKTQLKPQALNVEVSFDHNVPALFVNPPSVTGELFPLRVNVGAIKFQNVNPGANATAQSFLRLSNNNAFACDVSLVAKDDEGMFAGPVKYTMAAHTSEQFNIDTLETGVDNRGRAISGKFGDGKGKWYVRVEPECVNFDASALNRNAIDGTVTNLTPQRNETFDNKGKAPLNP